MFFHGKIIKDVYVFSNISEDYLVHPNPLLFAKIIAGLLLIIKTIND